MKLQALGVGLTHFPGLSPVLEECAGLIDLLEIEPQTFWFEGGDVGDAFWVNESVLEALTALPFPKLIHGVGFPVGGTEPPDAAQLGALRRCIAALEAPMFSEHLSFNRVRRPDGSLFYTGFLLPPLQTPESVASAVSSIRSLTQHFVLPFAVETGVNYLRPLPGEMPDVAFVAAVVEQADCGILLDLHNLYANQRNGRQPLDEFLAQIPLDRVWELHLAGGHEHEGYWLDAHSGGMPQEVFEAALRLARRLPNLQAIVFEVFPPHMAALGPAGFRRELENMRRIWDARGADLRQIPAPTARRPVASQPLDAGSPVPVSPVEWENALGSLVTRQPAGGRAAHLLAEDPGIEILRKLVDDFRSGVLVRTLPLTTRLLLFEIGLRRLQELLADFFRQNTPELFGSREAAHFGQFLRRHSISVRGFDSILEFELATIQTLMDQQSRTVVFPFDPMPVLRALGEGRIPEVWIEQETEIQITPDEAQVRAGTVSLNPSSHGGAATLPRQHRLLQGGE
jgi:uncharacterized protein (UPF0276 family)